MNLIPSLRPRSLCRLLSISGLALALVGACSLASVALAQSEVAIGKVKDLNQKALAAYESLELEEARKALMEALQICAQEGMNEHPWKARTHIHLGAILAGGFQQRELAIKQFQRAIEIQPDISLTPSLRNPETQAVFDEAKKGGAAPPTPAPAPVPAPVLPAAPEIKGIYHKPVATAPAGATVDVRARVGKDVTFHRLVLAYRPEGATGFLARDMDAEAEGWFSARIPEAATQGGLVQYYIEARDEAGRATATNGSEAEPHVVALGDAALAGLDDASLVEADEDDEQPEGLKPAAPDRTGLVFGISVGSGMGYVSGTPEVNPRDSSDEAIDFSGVAPSKLGHLNVEAGYALQPGFIVSLQLRMQTISGPTEAVGFERDENDELRARKFSPAKGAVSVFGKATWLLGAPGTLRPYVSAIGGAGELRHVVNIGGRRRDCGPLPSNFDSEDPETFPSQRCVDTVNSGPVFAGGGAGVILKVGDMVGITAGLNALVGLPNLALHADFNVGMLLLL